VALANDDKPLARRMFDAGFALCGSFRDHDPRRAASLYQTGLAAEDARTAACLFSRADSAWRETRSNWIALLPLSGAARSSTFHLRLKRKHRGGYDRLARAERENLVEGGRATVLAALARLHTQRRQLNEADADIEEALALRRTCFGHREAGVAALLRMRASIASARGDQDTAERLEAEAAAIERDPVRLDAARLARETGPRYDNDWRLKAAVYLCPIPKNDRPELFP